MGSAAGATPRKAVLSPLWRRDRYRSLRRSGIWRVGLLFASCLGALIYAAVQGSVAGVALASVGSVLVAASVGFRAPSGFVVAWAGSLMSYVGAFLPWNGGYWIALAISSFTAVLPFDALARRGKQWQAADGR